MSQISFMKLSHSLSKRNKAFIYIYEIINIYIYVSHTYKGFFFNHKKSY